MGQIWPLRERIVEGLLMDGYCFKYDISLPLDAFYDRYSIVILSTRYTENSLCKTPTTALHSVLVMREKLSGSPIIRCCGYGHVGDGNMHLSITAPEYDSAIAAKIEPFVYEWTSKHRGSVSAEHGKDAGQRLTQCVTTTIRII